MKRIERPEHKKTSTRVSKRRTWVPSPCIFCESCIFLILTYAHFLTHLAKVGKEWSMHLAQHVDFSTAWRSDLSLVFFILFPSVSSHFLRGHFFFFYHGSSIDTLEWITFPLSLGPSLGCYSLKWVAGICPLELWRDGDSFVVHFPVEGASHGIPSLCLIPKVIVVNDIDHGAHDGFVV